MQDNLCMFYTFIHGINLITQYKISLCKLKKHISGISLHIISRCNSGIGLHLLRQFTSGISASMLSKYSSLINLCARKKFVIEFNSRIKSSALSAIGVNIQAKIVPLVISVPLKLRFGHRRGVAVQNSRTSHRRLRALSPFNKRRIYTERERQSYNQNIIFISHTTEKSRLNLAEIKLNEGLRRDTLQAFLV